MTTTLRALIIALTVLSLLGASAASAKRRGKKKRAQPRAPAYVIERLEDGLTLVLVKAKGSRVSMRYAVRGGAFDDPAEKAGVAHLVQHLVFQGSYDIPEGALEELARSRGATVSARTHPTYTSFSLDAPRDAFLELAGLYVRLVTNPALQLADLDREKRLIEGERTYEGVPTLLWALDQLAFPAENRGRTVLGSKRTRADIHAEDLATFYGEHYAPSNSVVLVVGDIGVAEVRAMLSESVLQPPVPARSQPSFDVEVNAPATAKVRQEFTGTASAYALGDVSPRLCEEVAGLLELRVKERVHWRDSLASDATVRCERLRGQSFVVAYALAKDAFGSRLPDVLAKVMTEASDRPLSKDERRVLLARHKALRVRERAQPERLADALTRRLLEQSGSLEENLSAHFRSPAFDWSALRGVLERAVTEKEHVLVHFSPYEG